MKVKFLMLVAVVIGLSGCKPEETSNVGCLSAGLQNGVVAFYPFWQGSLGDVSSNNNDLSNTTAAAPTSDRDGNPNCAYEFTNNQSAGQFLTRTSTNFLDGLTTFSISLWYMPEDTARDGGAYEVLINRGDQSHCPDRWGEWSVSLYDCRRAVFAHNNSVWADRVSGSFDCQSEVNSLTGKWQHVVAVRNNDQYKLYFNGNLDDAVTGNAVCSGPLYLAQDMGDLFVGKYYTGKIDDIVIYNRELTQPEVTALFNLAPCCQ